VDFKVRRQTARPHQGKEKIIKDIVDIWQVIDREKGGALPVKFVAADPNHLPSVAANQFNLQFLVSAILKLQEQVSGQQTTLSAVTDSLTGISKSLEAQPKQHEVVINNKPTSGVPTRVTETISNDFEPSRFTTLFTTLVPTPVPTGPRQRKGNCPQRHLPLLPTTNKQTKW
jgi:hypothetical protein